MEKELMTMNLGEAEIHLKDILDKLKNKTNYDIGEFQIDIENMMAHVNIAYNISTWNKERIEKEYSSSFNELIKIPENKYLID
jgi:hypothetical protein